MFTEEDKKYILNQFLINISGISDKEYQKRVWIRGEGTECDDFDETVCRFLDSWRFISEKYQDFQITDEQYNLLKEFREKFEIFVDDNYWPPEFIDSPEWEKIIGMAKDVLKAFNFQKNQ